MKDFIQQAIRTESQNFFTPNPRLLHAAIGCVTEAGEMLDALKKQMFYGKELDLVNFKEEMGDLLWYLAIAMDELGTTFSEEEARVIAKLKHRYPGKFTKEAAEHRDLAGERLILEKE